ncbi:unnamed protein product [Cuscuta epithymum]|uniref:Uncharacterized protein n=1 Tax=Cuscuta epithymum TaxID=186058 RepID=A0AAV0E0P5_9ASTE|nr:unnamed protein product [Cuscuta epithymum]CAH9147024.1 unnamed protein product [Cuscuta epithymum]
MAVVVVVVMVVVMVVVEPMEMDLKTLLLTMMTKVDEKESLYSTPSWRCYKYHKQNYSSSLMVIDPVNKNRRHNTSILIRHLGSSGTSKILIDAGMFYHSCLRWFRLYGFFYTSIEDQMMRIGFGSM